MQRHWHQSQKRERDTSPSRKCCCPRSSSEDMGGGHGCKEGTQRGAWALQDTWSCSTVVDVPLTPLPWLRVTLVMPCHGWYEGLKEGPYRD